MNLHAIAGPIVATVNPWVLAQYRQPTGTYTTAADGTRTPSYLPDVDLLVQRQALASDKRVVCLRLSPAGSAWPRATGSWSRAARSSTCGCRPACPARQRGQNRDPMTYRSLLAADRGMLADFDVARLPAHDTVLELAGLGTT